MKSLISTIFLIVLIGAFVIYNGCTLDSPVQPNQNSITDTDPFPVPVLCTVDLIAGQNIYVGNVQVGNDASNIYVQYNITLTGWSITQTHLHIADNWESIPQKNGNPIPGKFAYKMIHDPGVESYLYTIPIPAGWIPPKDYFIAAHADVLYDNCASTGITYGMERNTGDVYAVDVVLGTASLLFSSISPPTSNISPIGLAYDGVNNRMYYCDYRAGTTPRKLYFWDGTTEYVAGTIGIENAAADFYNGKYYYISSYPGTDDLYEVTFNADGTILTNTKIDDIADNAHGWTFDGDIGIKNGILYGWGSCTVSGHGYEFFTYDLTSGTFSFVKTGFQYSLQLAFGTDGTLYGHRSAAPGNYYAINVTNGTVSAPIPITPGKLYTDCASGMLCVPTVNNETAWGSGLPFPGSNWAMYFNCTLTTP